MKAVSQMSVYSFKMNNRMEITDWNEFKINHSSPEYVVSKNSSVIYDLNPATGFLLRPLNPDSPSGVKWLDQYLEANGEVQRTPLRWVHCRGNNSATFHHSIVISLKVELNRTHEAHERKDRESTARKEEGGRGGEGISNRGGAGALKGWAFKMAFF